MILTAVTDLNNPTLQIYKQLRDNATTSDNSFIADSPKVVLKLLESDLEISSILATKKFYDEHKDMIMQKQIPFLYVADKKIMREIVGHNIHHGVMMHGKRPDLTTIENMDDHIVMLHNISKNENVGAIARSIAALGVNSLIVSKKSPHPYGRKALRVSMGYVSNLKIAEYDDITKSISLFKKLGYKIIAAEITENSINLQDVKVPKKWVLIMGDEHFGISSDVLNLCDEVVKIEMMPEVKSFNVAVACSLLVYQFML
jgi:tRNA G18 (ribose-2'-O)-methylase SpoU